MTSPDSYSNPIKLIVPIDQSISTIQISNAMQATVVYKVIEALCEFGDHFHAASGTLRISLTTRGTNQFFSV